MSQRYYCKYCNQAYAWSQEAQTPGFCSARCRTSQSALARQPSFRDLLQHQIQNQLSSQHYNSVEPVILARDPAPPPPVTHCETCGIDRHCDQPIALVLVHLDHNRNNDAPANLRRMCPNCASQVQQS